MAKALKPDFTIGKLGLASLWLWIVLSLYLACYILGPWLLLGYYYGFSRVLKEGLHFTYRPSSKDTGDFMVSNGDHISKADAFVSLPIDIAVWVALSLTGLGIIKLCSRRRKEAGWHKAIKEL